MKCSIVHLQVALSISSKVSSPVPILFSMGLPGLSGKPFSFVKICVAMKVALGH